MNKEEFESIRGAQIIGFWEDAYGNERIILSNGKVIAFHHCETDAAMYVDDETEADAHAM